MSNACQQQRYCIYIYLSNSVIEINPNQLNNISIRCELGENLTRPILLNGMPAFAHNMNLDIRVREITMEFLQLGIVSIYDRYLIKKEIMQHHYIDFHISIFSDEKCIKLN